MGEHCETGGLAAELRRAVGLLLRGEAAEVPLRVGGGTVYLTADLVDVGGQRLPLVRLHALPQWVRAAGRG